MRPAKHSLMKLSVEALSPDQKTPLDVIGELRRLRLDAERYSSSDMLLIRRIIEKLLSARLYGRKAYTEFSFNLPC